VKAHLSKPDLLPAPEAYRMYCLERRFWEEFGAPQPPLDDWPRRKVAEYICVQRAIDEVEQERAQRDQRANSAGLPNGTARPTTPADITDQAYQQLRAQAVPPPMPSAAPAVAATST